jgi:AbrB family looped-hinge helix DNA binding protein
MITKLTLDSAGRVVLPKPVRDDLQVGPGDSLELESSQEQIILRPLRGTMPLRKKKGIWVFRTGEPLSAEAVNQAMKEVRQERERSNLGSIHQKRNPRGGKKSSAL